MQRSRWVVLAVVLIAASLAVVNATVFAYRELSGSINVVQSTGLTTSQAASLGAGCTGFYILGAASGNTISNKTVLPAAGTNHENIINGNSTHWLGIKTVFGSESCSWNSNGTNTLYDSATIYMNVSQGSWYAKDILGFGYPNLGNNQPNPVYVTIKVLTAINATNIEAAQLIVYKGGTLEGTIDLTNSSAALQVQLAPGEGLQLDLYVKAKGAVDNVPFTLGFYVATTNEQPR
jgi:hypothetical protein